MKVRVYLTNGDTKEYDVTRYDFVENLVVFKKNQDVMAVFVVDKIVGFDFVPK